jgi:hypothetical protein
MDYFMAEGESTTDLPEQARWTRPEADDPRASVLSSMAKLTAVDMLPSCPVPPTGFQVLPVPG